MKLVLEKISKLYRQVRGLFPSKLPIGYAQFDAWADSIINTYKMPTDHRDSILWSLSNMIMHMGPKDAYKSKFYFFLMLHASATKQIAHGIFNEVKTRQKQAEQEAAKKQQSEATDTATVTPIGNAT